MLLAWLIEEATDKEREQLRILVSCASDGLEPRAATHMLAQHSPQLCGRVPAGVTLAAPILFAVFSEVLWDSSLTNSTRACQIAAQVRVFGQVEGQAAIGTIRIGQRFRSKHCHGDEDVTREDE